MVIYCDNNAAHILSEDPLLHACIKHMDIKYHYLQECVENHEVILKYISTRDNLADALTKPLECQKFICFCMFLGLQDLPEPSTGGAESSR